MKNKFFNFKNIISNKSIYIKKYIRFFILSTFIIVLSLCSVACKQNPKPVTKTAVLFDTVVSITLYSNNSSEWIDKSFELAKVYDNLFSKTCVDSDIYKINNSNCEWVLVAPDTMNLITTALSYEKITDGQFSIMCGALTDLWDIKDRTIPPSDADITSAKELCGNDKLEVDVTGNRVRINTPGAKIDLGAVAKGYIADRIREYLEDNDIHEGIIQLGGNVLVFGNNPNSDNGYYTIGITEPFSDDSNVITTVSIPYGSVVTSGNYQRYFEYEGSIYHHIIDLKTGYPANTDLNSVTIVCDKSVEADCLSTICFLLGADDSVKLIDELNNTSKTAYQVILIDRDNNIINY